MKDQEKLIKKLEKYQKDNKKDKYVQILKHVDDYGYEVETHEYVCPNGSIGYQTRIFLGNFSKSIDFGDEAKMRTWERTE